jgi:branched-chain amino acid aminotransferase
MATIFRGWSPAMAVAECSDGHWGAGELVASGPVAMHPGAMAVQFGQSVFEGCRAHRHAERGALVFRLADHHARMVASCERLGMPAPPRALFEASVRAVVSRPESWDRPFASQALYIRPVVFGTDDHVMPVSSSRHVFAVLTAPLGAWDGDGLRLWVERRYSRAAPGGLGASKTAANYAHQLLPTQRARARGADAVLWLDCAAHAIVEEASTMNVFFVVSGRVITPALGDTVLAGITRRSALWILTERLGVPVEETAIEFDALVAGRAGRLDEVFCASTALGVQPVVELIDGERRIWSAGPPASPATGLAARVRDELEAIQRGARAVPWITEVALAEAAA